MDILEELKKFKCGNEDFERGFTTAIDIVTALNKDDKERIEILEDKVKKLETEVSLYHLYTSYRINLNKGPQC